MKRHPAPFTDRRQAGRELALAVADMDLADPVILALPRGGVPVAFEIALRLNAPLDLLMVRKIGAPGNREFGIGAVVDGSAKQVVIDHDMAGAVGASEAYIDREIALELAEIERRRRAYGMAAPVPVKNRTVVVVDDGIATGNTIRAALLGLEKAGAARIVLAIPVAPQDVLSELATLCDDLVCLATPEPFRAVGTHYLDFGQTSDDEVKTLLQQAPPALTRAAP